MHTVGGYCNGQDGRDWHGEWSLLGVHEAIHQKLVTTLAVRVVIGAFEGSGQRCELSIALLESLN